jgi:hypothetical protein
MLRNLRKIAVSTLVAIFSLSTATAQSARDVDPVFADRDILEVRLSAPIKSIMDERSVEDEVPGTFAYTESDGTAVEFYVAIRARGNFRRRKNVCSFTPLRLNFKKSETKNTLFDKQDKVKLVTHCKSGSPRYQQTIVTEYLAYQVFNLLTDVSFRARLLQIEYTDTENPNWENSSYAFLIEHKARLAKHIDAPELEISGIAISELDADHTNLGSLFQYFIGNTDFSPISGPTADTCCHNYVLLGTRGQRLYPIPYDFDQTGFVKAPHAQPKANLGARTITQRIYRGRCINNAQLPRSIARFQERHDDIVALIENQPGLDKSNKKRLLRYTEAFYKIIDDPKAVEKKLTKKCLG